MRITVVTPPLFVPSAPAAAPAVLVGLLRSAGHEAICFDVSRFCFDDLLEPRAVREALWEQGESFLAERGAPPAFEELPELVRLLREEATYGDLPLYEAVTAAVELGMEAQARRFGATQWSSREFHGDHDRTDPEALLDAVSRRSELLDAPLDRAVRTLESFRPDLVLVSVSYAQQLYGALRFAYAIRALDPRPRLAIGGATITRLREDLRRIAPLFDLVDLVLLRDGEIPILQLVAAVEENRDSLDTVSGLLARRGEVVVESRSPSGPKRPLAELPTPVFEDLAPGPYLAPFPLLPVASTRNSYHDRCTFCAIGRSFRPGFQEMAPEQMVGQVRELQRLHPGARFVEVSEALVPRTALAFADRLALEEEPLLWEAYLRFETRFAREDAARRLRRGGLRVAYFGLETASPPLLREMRKGIDIERAERAIRHFADAGIWVHLFLISGAPREQETDHRRTLRFLERNAAWIHSVEGAEFQIERDSDVSGLAETYGFVVAPPGRPSFRLDVPFRERGTLLPPAETAHRRAEEIRRWAATPRSSFPLHPGRIWGTHRLLVADGILVRGDAGR